MRSIRISRLHSTALEVGTAHKGNCNSPCSIADSLLGLGSWCGENSQALDYFQQAFRILQELFGEQHPSTVKLAKRIAITLVQLNRRKEAYDLVRHFVVLAQGPDREQLKQLEAKLLSQPIRPGFRQPSKTGKRKAKKKRR